MTVSPVAAPQEVNTFDLTFNAVPEAEGLGLLMTYSTDLLDGTTVQRWLGNLRQLLASMAVAPAAAVAALEVMPPAERQQVLREWDDGVAEMPAQQTVGQLFLEVAGRFADSAAVEAGGQSLSYRQLVARGEAVARGLASRGITAGDAVGVCLEISAELPVALVGCLLAGATYVPIDPAYPRGRIEHLLTDSGVPLVIASPATAPVLTDQAGRERGFRPAVSWVEDLEAEGAAQGRGQAMSSTVQSSAWQPVYLMYTSGSTGLPKGVAVSHQGILRLVRNTNYMEFRPDERFAFMSNPAFDASTLELWGPLLNGGCLVGIERDTLLSPPALAEALKRERITALFLTTALFNQVAALRPEAFSAVRTVLFGGEAADLSAVRRVLAAQPPERLINGYGPTENTTFTTWQSLGPLGALGDSVPIGRAVANSNLVVLDHDFLPVPQGAVGELCTGGRGLALAYHRRPALTAERFVPDPRPQALLGARLYRTGDLVRWRPEGAVEFVGRRDHQIKLCGFRIEAGEVEAALLQLPGLDQASVQLREDSPGDPRLVAYLAAAASAEPSEIEASRLSAYLRERLPAPMVPSAFVFLEALPLNANGKIDRNALPAPKAVRQEQPRRRRRRTVNEERVAAIWSEVLGISEVGPEDNFFELGGHSLLASQVISRVRETFGIDVPLSSLFEFSTLGDWVRSLEGADSEGLGLTAVEAREGGGGLPLSFAQQRLWFIESLESGSSHYNVPTAIRLVGALDCRALQRSLSEIERRHEALRTSFEADRGTPFQRVHPASSQPLPVVDLQRLPEPASREMAAELGRREAARPFDLAGGPVWRTLLLRLGGEDHRVLLTLHHIVSDAWSMGLLVKEVSSLYGAFVAGEPSPLPPLAVQYGDFALWQRRWLQGKVLEQQLEYWQRQLGEATEPLDLPADRLRQAFGAVRGESLSFPLRAEVAAAVEATAKDHGATFFIVVLAVFQLLLARLSGQRDIAVGSPIANRNRSEIEGLIGFFANTLVLKTRSAGRRAF